MAAAAPTLLIHDFVGLPIFVSDFDALTSSSSSSNANPNNGPAASSTQSPIHESSTSSIVSTAYSNSTTSALQQNWTTGFSDFADELWAKMTQSMKSKLREACVEVLRKTEEGGDGDLEHMGWQYDDDARFLD